MQNGSIQLNHGTLNHMQFNWGNQKITKILKWNDNTLTCCFVSSIGEFTDNWKHFQRKRVFFEVNENLCSCVENRARDLTWGLCKMEERVSLLLDIAEGFTSPRASFLFSQRSHSAIGNRIKWGIKFELTKKIQLGIREGINP